MSERLVNLSCSHVGLGVRDLERSVEYYMGIFGFENREDGWAPGWSKGSAMSSWSRSVVRISNPLITTP